MKNNNVLSLYSSLNEEELRNLIGGKRHWWQTVGDAIGSFCQGFLDSI